MYILRTILSCALLLAALWVGGVTIYSTFNGWGESLIDQGNLPTKNVYRISDGILIMPGLPIFLAVSGILSVLSAFVALYKIGIPTRFTKILYMSSSIYAGMAVIVSLGLEIMLYYFGDKYA